MLTHEDAIVLLYVPCPSIEVAQRISEVLLSEGLAACTNRFDGVTSMYQWQGRTETSTECVLLVKSVASKEERARERIRTLHPYETPCLMSLNPSSVNTDYASWLRGQLG